ncbi:MAG: hypothetical protein WAU47_02015, partial [Desulfobaccales bacterium]
HIQEFVSSYRLFLFLGSQIVGLSFLYCARLLRKTPGKASQLLGWLVGLGGLILSLPVLSALVLFIILRAGWLYPPQEQKKYLRLAFYVLLVILLPSVLHVMYIAEAGHPILRADLTTRLWVPFAVVLAAIFGRGLWWVFQHIKSGSQDFLPGTLKEADSLTKTLTPRRMWAALVIFLVFGYAPHLGQAHEERDTVKHFMLVRQNVMFDPGQVRWLFEHTAPEDVIVYNDDFLRHYFLSHGGLGRRAVYVPLQPLPESFDLTPAKVKYEIGWNPFLAVQHYENVRSVQYPLIIPGGSVYTLTLEGDFLPFELQLLPAPPKNGSSRLRLIRQSAAGLITTADIHLDGDGWQVVPLAPEPGGSLSLVNLDPHKPAPLGGLRFGGQPHHPFLWPWVGVEKVSMDDRQLSIQRSAPLPGERKIMGFTFGREALQDKGSTVLWRLIPRKEG